MTQPQEKDSEGGNNQYAHCEVGMRVRGRSGTEVAVGGVESVGSTVGAIGHHGRGGRGEEGDLPAT